MQRRLVDLPKLGDMKMGLTKLVQFISRIRIRVGGVRRRGVKRLTERYIAGGGAN